jgi:hypothetical protein
MSVNATVEHREYSKIKDDYRKMRDCYVGTSAIKRAREKYLPIPDATNTNSQNLLKYSNYLLRAVFLNVVAPTLDTMVGSIFRREPNVKLPDEIAYIKDDALGAQIPLLEFAKEAVTELGLQGSYGILVDQFPSEAVTRADESEEGLKPRFTPYPAEAISNWHDSVIDGIRRPDLIELQEEKETPTENNPFEFDVKQVTRRLFIEGGVYKQTLWEKDVQIPFDTGEYEIIPKKTGGSTFNYIPFIFLGITSNTSKKDQPPLLPLAELNLGHYRNSADLEEACFLTGQPTLVMSGLPQAWVDQNLKSGVLLGSGSSIPLPVGATAQLLQAQPNNLVSTEMKNKEERMLKVGMRATDGTRGRETATAASIRISTDEALMTKLSDNVSLGITQALYYLYDYYVGRPIDNPDDIVFKLNKVFYTRMIDPQLILALIATFEKGLITFDELRDNMLEMGVVIDEESDVDELKATYQTYVDNKQDTGVSKNIPEPLDPAAKETITNID